MRVALDARPLTHPQAGGFRSYVRGLVAGLRQLGGVDVLLYTDRPVENLPEGFTVRVLSPDRLKTDLRLFAAQVKNDAPDIVHGTMNYVPATGRRSCVTLHDAMGIKRYAFEEGVKRNPREWLMNRYWFVQTRLSARRCQRLVTVSHGAAEELSDALGIAKERFEVVYNGIQLPPPCRGVVREASAVLALASPDPRKNLDCLYRAVAQHAEAFGKAGAPRLHVVGTSQTTAQRAEAALASYGIENYTLLRGLDDQALSNAYARAAVFAWPSWLEGFGMPPVEAMAASTPVVSSHAPPMPEVLGDAPVFFDPARPDELARALAALLADPEQRAVRGAAGKERAARYTTLAQAEGTLAVWKAALP